MYFFCKLRRFKPDNPLDLSKNFRSKWGNSYTNWYKLFTLSLNRPDSNKITLWRSEGLCNFHLFLVLFTWEFEERPPTQTAPLERWWPESSSSCTVEMCESATSNHMCFLWFCKKKPIRSVPWQFHTCVQCPLTALTPSFSCLFPSSFLPMYFSLSFLFDFYFWVRPTGLDGLFWYPLATIEGNMFHISLPPLLAIRNKNTFQLSSNSKNT